MKGIMKKTAACVCAAALSLGALAGCGSGTAAIDGTKTVLTVNDETLPLGVLSYMTRYQQAQIYYFYNTYLGYYGMSGMFDTVTDSDTGATYGDSMKQEIVEDVEEMMLIRQHAEEYGIALTDEEKASIEEVADAWMEKNSEEARAKVGASRENVIELLTLMTLKSHMMDVLAEEVDTVVSDEEKQTASVSYIEIPFATADDVAQDNTDSDAASGAESAESTESTDSAATEEATDLLVAEMNKQRRADAASMIQDIIAAGTAEADFTAIAKEYSDDYTASHGHFLVSKPEDATLDANVVAAVKDLSDGDVVEEVVEGADGSSMFVVRLDTMYDEEESQTKADSVIVERKEAHYNEVVDAWKEEASITLDEAVWATVTVNDSETFTFGVEETASADSAAESTAATEAESTAAAESEAASTAESTDSTASEASAG